ncbi:hypothetical protein J41TS12_44920 [Paenibacillus antibioticophila]|uniref:DoxX family protein n=1 Tax=Paenibacillus antibioticophila TaxID=1274374 RepID=A0A919XW95_9BACL|nr:hypothetical protein [Paenibacillus antibioticophila]GIO39631.1 hypothetical protein J41TS12_44920 [Paenibacillus antibioticophila]
MKKKSITVIRILFGLMLLAFGIIGLLNLAPESHYAEPATNFMDALIKTGYIMVVVLIMKLLVGTSLLINRFVPLALVLFMPISVNMFLFHLFLDTASIFPALVIVCLNGYLLFAYLEKYKPFLGAKI